MANPNIQKLTAQIEALDPDDRVELFSQVFQQEVDRQMLLAVLAQQGRTSLPENRESTRIEAEIDLLYDEIRDLVARSAEEPSLESDIEAKRRQLRTLQQQDAKLMECRADARLHLKPGEGYEILARAESLLER